MEVALVICEMTLRSGMALYMAVPASPLGKP